MSEYRGNTDERERERKRDILEVFNRRLDRILGQHAAMELNGGQVEVLGNICVFNIGSFVDVFSLNPIRCVRSAKKKTKTKQTQQ